MSSLSLSYFICRSLSADAEKAGKRSVMISLSDLKRETEILEDGISQIHSNQVRGQSVNLMFLISIIVIIIIIS